MALDWVIYYSDGTTFSDLDGLPEESPIKQVVCLAHRKNAWTAHKLDWYYWDIANDEWWGGDLEGLLYQARKNVTNLKAVRKGYYVSDSYGDYMWRAFKDRTS